MPQRPALIFDFGNVVAFFDYARAGATLGRPLGLSGEAFVAKIREAGFTPLLRDYESGRITSEVFTRGVCDLVGLDVADGEFAVAWADIFTLNAPVVRLVADLKAQGFRLILGSNTNDIHANHFRREFAEALAPFDALVLSHEVGYLKPARDFYLACARAAAAEPGDCVFIDDMPENVEGARAAGLVGIIFRDVPRLIVDLAARGIGAS